MLGQDSLERAAQAAGIDAPVLWRDQTGSTNTDAVALAERGAPDLTVVAAGHQVAGRGRMGRAWTSPPGASLLLSVVLRPDVPGEALGLVALTAALEMAGSCRSVLGLPVRLKWPNDLLVRRRKIAGVLPEAKLAGGTPAYVVVGIGVNLAQREEDFPPDLRGAATSAALEGAAVTPEREEALVSGYLTGLRGARIGAADWAGRVISAASSASATLGGPVRATTIDGRTVEGYAAALDPFGGLVIVSGGTRHTVAFGEVEHLRAPG